MIQEPNENFGLEGCNFQLANEKNEHESNESKLDNAPKKEYDPYRDDLGDDDLEQNIDEDLDDDGDNAEDDFDEKDKSDY